MIKERKARSIVETDQQYNCLVINNSEELLAALENKEPSILIPQQFKSEFLVNTQLPMSENEKLGFELGFRGAATLTDTTIFHLINWLSKDSKQQKRIDSKIRKYTLKKYNEGLLLYLSQLDYYMNWGLC